LFRSFFSLLSNEAALELKITQTCLQLGCDDFRLRAFLHRRSDPMPLASVLSRLIHVVSHSKLINDSGSSSIEGNFPLFFFCGSGFGFGFGIGV
jgi:hypothetical protein